MKIVVGGGTGFIGGALVEALAARKQEVVVLSRKVRPASRTVRYVLWDGKTAGPWEQNLEGAEAVVNLSGSPIAGKRWTASYKREIVTSRLDPTRALVQAVRTMAKPPRVFLSGSAVGYYGSTGSETDELSPAGRGFLAETCQAWEQEALQAEQAGVRVVLLRTGLVLGRGGLLARMVPAFRGFAGGPFGSGEQWMPWIHLTDEIGAALFLLKHGTASGPFNLTAPGPVTMREFCRRLGEILGRPSWLRVPAGLLHFVFGEMAEEVLLSGQNARPRALEALGFRFRYGILQEALSQILAGGDGR
ncbi:MAG: TIGR01777 family oxidoreductase [Candidatus Omnitrophota bacterium]